MKGFEDVFYDYKYVFHAVKYYELPKNPAVIVGPLYVGAFR